MFEPKKCFQTLQREVSEPQSLAEPSGDEQVASVEGDHAVQVLAGRRRHRGKRGEAIAVCVGWPNRILHGGRPGTQVAPSGPKMVASRQAAHLQVPFPLAPSLPPDGLHNSSTLLLSRLGCRRVEELCSISGGREPEERSCK